MGFLVSVIIPVYNAEKFLRTAVESAVTIPQVGEVILVEDGSPDNALALCHSLKKKFEKVKLYRHPNGENKGAGASRNLGVEKSSYPFIAFLDADDTFLPNRFEVDEKIFSSSDEVDGVYSAVGVHFYDERGRSEFKKIFNDADTKFLTTIKKENISKNELILSQVKGKFGHFCTDGITFKRELFFKAGGFNVDLRLHQDTLLWAKFAYYGTLKAGNLKEAVALRGVHDKNRHTQANSISKLKLYEALFEWGYSVNIHKSVLYQFYMLYCYSYKGRYNIKYNKIKRGAIFVLNSIEIISRHPRLLALRRSNKE